MNTYLFVWNPKRWTWHDIEKDIQQVNADGQCAIRWSCGVNKSIKAGDRMFIVKVGTEPKGIVAAGEVTSSPFLDTHWSGENREALFINGKLDVLLNPEKDPILALDILKTGNLAAQNWLPQASGISVRPELVDELEAVWFDFLTTYEIRDNPFVPDKSYEQQSFREGTPNQVVLTKYERNPYARKACIEHYGLSCIVCEINFECVYGELGKDFIDVHHLTQVSKIGKEYIVDPVTDLRPVCPNCHAMLHRKKEGISIEELKSLMSEQVNTSSESNAS